MTLLQEITSFSDAYWAGVISIDTYYMLCDWAIETYKN